MSGFWTGVRGMRFVRPTLLSEDRQTLATLEHTPWAPSETARWTAAFPWTDGIAVDADSLSLKVAPKVIVPLAATATRPPAVAEPAPEPESALAQQPAPVSAAAKHAAATSSPTPAAAPTTPALASTTNGASATPPPVIPVDARADELARALATAEGDRDRALAQLAEAIEAREAAILASAGMEIERDAALEAHEVAESALAEATAGREEADVRRDEVLVAYRTLQRELQAERAQADRDARGDEKDGATDEPLGVRTLPAVRGVMAELQYPRRESRLGFTRFDLWVVRVLALGAAGCFFLLMYSILRVVV